MYRHYDLSPMTRPAADALWRALNAEPGIRRPYAGLLGERLVAMLILRSSRPQTGAGEIGIVLDPAEIGRGLGPRILRAFIAVLAAEGLRRLSLEVAGFNRRAIGAYRAVGFAITGEHWGEAEPGLDLGTLLMGPGAAEVAMHVRPTDGGGHTMRILRMERRLDQETKD
jgi:RimJ/RimL family protein N-acetyltransferase